MLNFPASPTDGQQYSSGERSWEWSAEKTAWELIAVSTADADLAAASAAAAQASETAADASAVAAAASAAGIGDAVIATAASAASAAGSADLAQEWATKTDAEVTIGQGYGAKKYAIDAAASAAQAVADVLGKVLTGLSLASGAAITATDTIIGAFGKLQKQITDALAALAPKDSPTFTGTVSGVTKEHVGLGNVQNLAPADMPVSTAQAAAMADLQGKITVDDDEPSAPVSGLEWFDGTSGTKFTRINDGTSEQWVELGPVSIATVLSEGGGTGEANTASNLGAGSGLFAQKAGVDLQFKSIVGGSNISVTPSASALTLAFTGALGEVNTASNVGTGAGAVLKAKSGVDFQLKTIKAGSNITVTNGADDITIAAAAPSGESNTASSLGGTSLVGVKSGVDLQFKGLMAGTGVILSPSSVAITVTTVIISSSDPGAVGPGVIWVTP